MAAPLTAKPRKKGNYNEVYRKEAIASLRDDIKKGLEDMGFGELLYDGQVNEPNISSRFTNSELITQRFEEVTRLAIDLQKDENLKFLLKAESKVMLLSALERNQKNQKSAEEHMDDLQTKFIEKYQKKIEEFVEFHSPLVFKQSILLQSFHDRTTQKLLQKYEGHTKPGSDDFKSKYKQRLSEKFLKEKSSKEQMFPMDPELTVEPLVDSLSISAILIAIILTCGIYHLETRLNNISETGMQGLASKLDIQDSMMDARGAHVQLLNAEIQTYVKKSASELEVHITNIGDQNSEINAFKDEVTLCAEITSSEFETCIKRVNSLQTEIQSLKTKIQSLKTDIKLCTDETDSKSASDEKMISSLKGKLQFLIDQVPPSYKYKLPKVFQEGVNYVTEDPIIGIDIGSKYSHAFAYFAGMVLKIPHYDQSGEVYRSRSMSTYVGVDKFEDFVGQSAQKKVETSLEFGTFFYDIIHFLQHEHFKSFKIETKYINFGFRPNAENKETTRSVLLANNQTYFVTDILSKLFRKLRDNASRSLNVNVSKCVIAFSGVTDTRDLQTKLISKGAEMAGFNEITFLPEAYAAGIGLITTKNTWEAPSTIFYINFDSRYWEFSVFQKVENKFNISDFEEKYGNVYDTGYLQNKLINYCLEEFIRTRKIFSLSSLKSDIIENKVRFRRLHESCDNAMASLSVSQTATVHVTKFFHGLDLVVNITRAKFEELCANTFSEISEFVNLVLTRAILDIADIDYVIITGDSSRIPKVQEIVTKLFGNKIVDLMGMQPDEVLAYGAAIYGAMLAQK